MGIHAPFLHESITEAMENENAVREAYFPFWEFLRKDDCAQRKNGVRAQHHYVLPRVKNHATVSTMSTIVVAHDTML